MQHIEIRHMHLFCGLGGGAKGFNRGQARVGSMQASFRCIGGIDCDHAAVEDFTRAAGAAGTCMDLSDREQYVDFHGHEPPRDWREATPADIQAAAGHERPHIVFLSAPCKGFSGLLSERKSTSSKYRALNRLTLRGIWLMLEAWASDPPELVIFENVPRIQTRGRSLLDAIGELLRSYGYAVAETTHDCGHLGGLAQSRKRFLMVARNREKVPPFLYEPEQRPLRGVGEVLERFPLPGAAEAGPMHRMPRLMWKTWLRLAFVEAGCDWRSLKDLRVEDGFLKDFGVVPEREYHQGVLGVLRWADTAPTVTGGSTPTNGRYSVQDVRFFGHAFGQYGVREWTEPTGAITAQSAPGGGAHSVADVRLPDSKNRHNNLYRVVDWRQNAHCITGAHHVGGGSMSIADPRAVPGRFGKYHITGWAEPAHTVIAGSTTGEGAFAVQDPRGPKVNLRGHNYGVLHWAKPAGAVTGNARCDNGRFTVADPRPGLDRGRGDNYLTGGHYAVRPWDEPSGAVSAAACHDNGPWSVQDPRLATGEDWPGMPEPTDRLVAVIRALDGTWHRPFTTLELAALQGLVRPEEHLELEGLSDSAWRERIGNAVPPDAAEAIAGVMGQTLLLAWSGETFTLGSTPIWVRPVATALAVDDRR